MPETIFKVGVLGATGFIGTPYREEIKACKEARIIALCARRRDLLEAAAKKDGASCITHNWREVVTHPDVNMVIVATPDVLHHEAIIACAKEGKHVLCEKPIGMHAGEAGEMWGAYRESTPPLGHFVPFWTRYVEVFRLAREIVNAGELGEIRSTVFRWHNPRPDNMPLTWRDDPSLSSAGTIADVGSHAYDVVRWIINAEATKVLAHGETLTTDKPDLGAINLREAIEKGQSTSENEVARKRGGNFDYASISCEFSNRATGLFVLSHTSHIRKFLAPELELHGTIASLSADRYSGKVILTKANNQLETRHELPPSFDFGNRFKSYVFPALKPILEGSRSEMKHPNLEDGLRAQQFTDAAYLSALEGKWKQM